ncbi:RIP metalloprotease RseP [Ruminiclostridium cellobioparum]|uniref:Zinc metalloprotease n=1 Tax=Ruminiclostridium cellobioparum subsp. termitidis CT1112 TaxID=1195236 RepID=S0FPE7_RUMCE|nr:RIP metalloprotease RseP [Ruminiclostridium cellobioparum]EMS74110.1 RIP metalloprotease RseP [Ruminiclostridium cellobioparum subsp. termitidis CT1112]
MGIVLAILALSFLIIIHELGHFMVAKAFKVRVNEFSLFMGPKLFSFQKGETLYSLRLIPLGGYVKMEGEEEASEDDRAYNKKPIGVRAAIIAAGPLMNILTAIVFAFIIISQTGYFTTQIKDIVPGSAAEKYDLRVGDKLQKYNGKTLFNVNDLGIFSYPLTNESITLQYERNGVSKTVELTPERENFILGFTPLQDELEGPDSNVVKAVSDNSPAIKAGLKVNDRIVEINGADIRTRKDIRDILQQNQDKNVNILVERAGELQKLKPVVPLKSKNPEYYAIGILDFVHEKGSIGSTIKEAAKYNIFISRSIYYSLGWLFTGTVPASELMGPVGITTTISNEVAESQSLKETVIRLLSITTMISINLGLVNLIPFPALDGSKLVLLLIEGIRKKPLNPEKEALITMVGMVILIMLMLYATFNDILRIGKG